MMKDQKNASSEILSHNSNLPQIKQINQTNDSANQNTKH